MLSYRKCTAMSGIDHCYYNWVSSCRMFVRSSYVNLAGNDAWKVTPSSSSLTDSDPPRHKEENSRLSGKGKEWGGVRREFLQLHSSLIYARGRERLRLCATILRRSSTHSKRGSHPLRFNRASKGGRSKIYRGGAKRNKIHSNPHLPRLKVAPGTTAASPNAGFSHSIKRHRLWDFLLKHVVQ